MKKCAILLFCATLSAFASGSPLDVSVLDSSVLCIRAGRVTADFSAQLLAAQPTNSLAGTVLDLRFSDGDNPADASGYFSQHKSPLVILVNSQTRGAAAALAAHLRTARAGLVIGPTNAPGLVAPDIAVAVAAGDEKNYQASPFAAPASGKVNLLSGTNSLLPFIDHMSEAELVRKKIKDGEDDGNSAQPRVEPAVPVIRDPALARAVDLLKALAILNKSRG